MQRASRAARAGLALSWVLFALALPRPGSRPEPCRQPRLRAPGEIVCEPAGAGSPRLDGPARRLFDLPIDPNRADAVTLETLPGIGPARARAILEQRCLRRFAELRDLERVRGLGPRRVGALAPHVAFEHPLAPCEATSVKSGTCRSSCEGTRARRVPAAEPLRPVEEGP